MYMRREIETLLESCLVQFKCVLVTARDRRETLRRHVLGDTCVHVALDDMTSAACSNCST